MINAIELINAMKKLKIKVVAKSNVMLHIIDGNIHITAKVNDKNFPNCTNLFSSFVLTETDLIFRNEEFINKNVEVTADALNEAIRKEIIKK